MKDPNAWKRGMERMRPGLYVDAAGALHIDEAEFLEAEGYAATKANAAMLRQVAAEMFEGATVEFIDHDKEGRK